MSACARGRIHPSLRLKSGYAQDDTTFEDSRILRCAVALAPASVGMQATSLGGGWLTDLGDYRAEREQRHQRDDAERDDAVDAPYAENVLLDVGEVEREGESAECWNEQEAVGAQEGEGGHENVSRDSHSGHGDGAEHRIGTVIDDAAIPVLVDAARRVAVLAVMLAQCERRNDDAEYGQDQQRIFHQTSFLSGLSDSVRERF